MSDEDRARYLQHKAEMEEEARRRKEQLISTFMKVGKRLGGLTLCSHKYENFRKKSKRRMLLLD